MTSKVTGKLVPSDDPAGVLQFVADMPEARRRKTRTTALLSEADTAPQEPMLDDVERVACLVKASDAARRELPRQLRVGSSGRVVTQAEILSKLLDAEEIRAEVVSGRRQEFNRCSKCSEWYRAFKNERGKRTCLKCRGLVCECGERKNSTATWCSTCGARPENVEIRKARRAESAKRLLVASTRDERVDRAKRANAALTPNQRESARQKAKERWHMLSEEERNAVMDKARSGTTKERMRERMHALHASLTSERRSEIAKKRHADKSQEQRSEIARKRSAAQTPEQRSEFARKANAAQTPEQRTDRVRKAWETRRAKAAAKRGAEKP